MSTNPGTDETHHKEKKGKHQGKGTFLPGICRSTPFEEENWDNLHKNRENVETVWRKNRPKKPGEIESWSEPVLGEWDFQASMGGSSSPTKGWLTGKSR